VRYEETFEILICLFAAGIGPSYLIFKGSKSKLKIFKKVKKMLINVISHDENLPLGLWTEYYLSLGAIAIK
jgi:hypothetical protein